MAADKYVPSGKIACDVTLVKPTENHATIEEDYGLSEVGLKWNLIIIYETICKTFDITCLIFSCATNQSRFLQWKETIVPSYWRMNR